jgi:hypothetical protein
MVGDAETKLDVELVGRIVAASSSKRTNAAAGLKAGQRTGGSWILDSDWWVCQSGPMEIDWPPRWHADAKEALLPYIGTDTRLEIIVGEPETSRDGSVLAGFL